MTTVAPEALFEVSEPLPNERAEHKQFTINVISNIFVFTVSFIINLWFTPYLIKNLSIAVYGIVPLATSLTNYMSLLTLSFQNAAGRFLTIAYNKQNYEEANRLFNTALLTVLSLSATAIPIALVVITLAPEFFDIPSEQEGAARILFGFIMATFVVNTIDGAFSISSWICNRFDLRNGIGILTRVLRVLIIVFAFQAFQPNISYIGMSTLIVTVITLLGDILLWRYLTPNLKIRLRMASRREIRPLTRMSGWMVINQIGSLLFLNIDLFVLNKLIGAEASGVYAPLLLIATYIRTFASLIVTALQPVITIQYAHQNWDGLRRRMQQAVKLLGLIIALPIGLIVGFSGPLLSLWLGRAFNEYSLVLVVMVIHLAVNLAVTPLFSLQIAYNKVKIPGVVTLLSGIANVFLAISWVKEFGIIGAPLSGLVVLTLKNLLFTPIYVNYIMKLPILTFYKDIAFSALGTCLVAMLAYILAILIPIENWFLLLILLAGSSLIYLIIVYFLFMNSDDRQQISRLVPWIPIKQV